MRGTLTADRADFTVGGCALKQGTHQELMSALKQKVKECASSVTHYYGFRY